MKTNIFTRLAGPNWTPSNPFSQRRALRRKDADQLMDHGIRQSDAIAEHRRFGWDVPSYWLS